MLGEAGFELVERSDPAGIPGGTFPRGSRVWVGERGLRRRGITASTAIVPIIAVFVAGSILGGLDAYIVGSPVVGILWVLGAAVTAGIFWLVYGGTYDSDFVLVTISGGDVDPDVAGAPVSAVFWAARVRSQIRADLRVPSVVSGPIKLAAEVGILVRRFQRKVTSPPASDRPGTAPA